MKNVNFPFCRLMGKIAVPNSRFSALFDSERRNCYLMQIK